MKIEIIEIDSDRNSSQSFDIEVDGQVVSAALPSLKKARELCKLIAPHIKPIERIYGE